MPSLREIKRRIKGVDNISQVTRAMQTVAAAKMRRAQEKALASRHYAQRAWEILTHLANQPRAVESLHPLLKKRPVENVCLILITADRGLAGGYNSNIIRTATQFIEQSDQPVSLITVGKRGRDYMKRHGQTIIAEFSDLPDRPPLSDILPITQVALSDFLKGKFDAVHIAYTNFVNTVTLEPEIKLLLPLHLQSLADQAGAKHLDAQRRTASSVYIYEPDSEDLLDVVLTRFLEWQIYQAVLEAQASEHSARMVAMRNATDNATELVSDLKLVYNQARQEAITKEMLDIAGGAEAQKQAANQ